MQTFKIDCGHYDVDADWYEGSGKDVAGEANHILLSLIGWKSDRKRYADITTGLITHTGTSALVFDYSGHGDSDFDIMQTRPAQHFLEVIYVFDWIKAHYPGATITVMGTSYGGYLATQLTKYRTFEGLILRVPAIYRPEEFYTINEIVNGDAGRLVRRTLRHDTEALAKHPLLARISSFKGKTLIVVHENDEAVPAAVTDAYIKAFTSDVYLAKGLPHSLRGATRDQITEYQTAISNWLTET